MKGEGNLEIELYEKNNHTVIDFKDSGSGNDCLSVFQRVQSRLFYQKAGLGLRFIFG